MSSPPPISASSPEFRRINRAMIFGGFSTFALLYCVQPLMPLLAHDFALTPAQSSLALSAATGTLAGTCTVAGTGGWQNWATVSCPVSATGTPDLYLRFTGGSGSLFNEDLSWPSCCC